MVSKRTAWIGRAAVIVSLVILFGGLPLAPTSAVAADPAAQPSASMNPLQAWLVDTDIPLGWSGQPALAPVTSYDVRYRRAPWNGPFGSAVTWLTATTATTATFSATPGSSYCFAVRATDANGIKSDWSNPACAAVPLDDRSLVRSAGWTAGTGTSFYRSTFLRSTTSGARLTRANVDGEQSIALVASTCPTCGTVKVYWGSRLLQTLSLYSPTRVNRKLLPVRVQEGEYVYPPPATLTIEVVSSGKKVIIDGVLATRIGSVPAWVDAGDPPAPATATSGHQVVAVSAGAATDWGGGHTCALKPDGTITCWGSNGTSQSVPPAGIFTAVSAGGLHTCGIRADGTLACWGTDGDVGGLSRPPTGTFVAVSAGGSLTCAIATDGTASCWTGNAGNDVTPPPGTLSSMSVGDRNLGACGIRPDGSLVCWGGVAAVDRPPAGTFSAVSVGTSHACALRTDGSLACWGGNEYGEASPSAGPYSAVSVGDLHTCAIRADGTLACWGDNEYFEATPPPGTFASLDAGAHHTCAIRTDGTFACWGQDFSGQVTPRPTTAVTPLPAWIAATTFPVSWRATSLAVVASYDVRYRRARWDGAFGAWTAWRTGTTATGRTFTGSPGYTYCLSARSHDGDGLTSPWTAETCLAVPLDDRSLARSSGWTAGTGSGFYRATFLRSFTLGAHLTRTGVHLADIALIATKCPTCGTVRVYSGSRGSKVVDLYAAVRVDRAIIPLWTSTRAGTLTVKIVSSGKKVVIDGVAIRRH